VADRVRVADLRRTPPARRCRARRTAASRRRGDRREDQDLRVRVHAPDRHAQPARSGPHPRGVVERLGRGGGGTDRAPRPPLAAGTQTAGSVVRPASYCGVLGLKPTFGVVPLAGALPTSASLDTVGLFARSVDDLELTLAAVSAAPAGMASARASRRIDGAGGASEADLTRRPRIGVLRMGWDLLEPAARNAIDRYVEAAAAAGAAIEDAELPVAFDRIVEAQRTIQAVETAWALGGEADWHGELVSVALRSYIDEGRAVARDDYLAARRLADEQRWRWNESIAQLDAV